MRRHVWLLGTVLWLLGATSCFFAPDPWDGQGGGGATSTGSTTGTGMQDRCKIVTHCTPPQNENPNWLCDESTVTTFINNGEYEYVSHYDATYEPSPSPNKHPVLSLAWNEPTVQCPKPCPETWSGVLDDDSPCSVGPVESPTGSGILIQEMQCTFF